MRVNRKKLTLEMAKTCLSAAELARKAKMPDSTLNRLMQGKEVFPVTAGKVARALGVDVTEIIELEDFQ